MSGYTEHIKLIWSLYPATISTRQIEGIVISYLYKIPWQK